MKKSKIKIVIMVVSLLFFVGTIGLIVSMNKVDKQTEDTTTPYIATVMKVDVANAEENTFAEIHTKEYSTSLYISKSICKNIKMDDIRSLKNGQTIFFRIENVKAQQMNKVEFVNITSLKTDTKDILSLKTYNECVHDSAYPARIASVVMASVFLFILIFCYFGQPRPLNQSGDG